MRKSTAGLIIILTLILSTSGCIFYSNSNDVIIHFKISNNSDYQPSSNITVLLDDKIIFNETKLFYDDILWRQIDITVENGKYEISAIEHDSNTKKTMEYEINKEVTIVITYLTGISGEKKEFDFILYDGDKLLY